MLIRLELVTPAGDLVTAETYNRLFTMHGVMMVFFFLIPAIPAVLGNFLVPLMIGAKDLAFPKLNLRELVHLHDRRAVHALRDRHRRRRHRLDVLHAVQHRLVQHHVIPAALGIFITGFSSILTGLNFIVTIHRMRAPGMTWFRLPLFIWSHLRDQPHHGARHAGHRDHDRAASPPSGCSTSASSIRRSAAIRSCSSICSGSTRIRPSTS